VFPAKLKKKTK